MDEIKVLDVLKGSNTYTILICERITKYADNNDMLDTACEIKFV